MYRETGRVFSVYQETHSFNRASHLITRFIAMCLRQVEEEPSSYHYQLPLQGDDISLANKLWDILKATELDLESGIDCLHKLFWSLCRSDTRGEEEMEMWGDPLKCFIAVINLTEDGTFRTASLVTSDLATWKHNLRAMVLHQVVISRNVFQSQQV